MKCQGNQCCADPKDQDDAGEQTMEALVHVSVLEPVYSSGFPGQEGGKQEDDRQVDGITFLKGLEEQEIDNTHDGLQQVDHKDQRGDIDELRGEVAGIAAIEDIEE